MLTSAFDPKRTLPLIVMVHATRLVFRLYAVVVALAIARAWYIDATMLNSHVEHLAPDMLLFFLSLPSSLTLPGVAGHWPGLLEASQYGPLVWLSVCGALQVLALILLEAVVSSVIRGRRSHHDTAMSASGR